MTTTWSSTEARLGSEGRGPRSSTGPAYGHTPLSLKEDIPWRCRGLVVGTSAQGALPVMDEVLQEAKRRKVELLSLPTSEAIAILNGSGKDTNAILHVTC